MISQENTIPNSVLQHIVSGLQAGQFSATEKSCRLALLQYGDSPALQFLLGAALEGRGKLLSALHAFERALRTPGAEHHVWSARASVLVKLGRVQEAAETLCQAIQANPQVPELLSNLGAVYEQLQQFPNALEVYRQALLIEPTYPVALVNMTAVLVKLGQYGLAVEQGRIAVSLLPPNADLFNNLTEAYIQMKRFPEALEICNQALQHMPAHAVLRFKQGLLLSYLQRFDEARKSLSLAQIINPDVIKEYFPQLASIAGDKEIRATPEHIFFDVAYHQQTRSDWRCRDAYVAALRSIMLDRNANMQPDAVADMGFQMLSLPISADERLSLQRRIADIYCDVAWQSEHPPYQGHSQHDRIRIGYVSPDFRKHPVGLLSRQIYGLHDRDRFEIYAYSLKQPEKIEDDVFQSIRDDCDYFHDAHNKDYKEIADQIAADEIDILVDLAGYTTYARPEIFALRPAPLQLGYLGYPSTTGASFIDYAIVDRIVGADDITTNAWSEALVRLPNAYCPYDSALDNALAGITREQFGLPKHAMVFCCFNNNYKIEPMIFASWMRILQHVPKGVIWLLGLKTESQQNLLSAAKMMGIKEDRLIFAGVLPLTEHIKRYQLADLFLDTYWHNAHTTAADALWQGLPVLTCEGPVASSRLASSLLHALNMQDELVTHSLEEFEQKAVYYATNPQALKTVRDKLAANRYSQPLFNTALTVKHLEQAYLAIWARYKAGLAPEAIDIADIREKRH